MTRREALAAMLAGPLFGGRSLASQATDLTALTIAEASTRLASGALTSLQLTNAYLSRIAAMNKSLNAYVTVTADLARREARALPDRRSRIWGIPIAHKDLFETRGVRTTAGSLLYQDYIPGDNAAVVQQLEQAGAVLLGKTNTHELGGGVTTINPFFGTTRSPIDLARIAGGSSGGSAAAVVAHLCAAATGSDTGGSVRIPAAFCGCVGFKPTFARISTQGLLGASATFDHVGFLARTVEDVGILFSAASGVPTAGAVTPARTILPAGARVGVARQFFFDDLDPAVAVAVDAAIARSRAGGMTVQDVTFPVTSKTMSQVFDPIVVFETWGRFGPDWRINPGAFSKDFAGFFSTPRPSIAEYESALAALKEYQAAVDRLFDSVDVIVTPTVPVTAPLINSRIDGMKILRNTWPFNAAGTPAVSIPVVLRPLPIGIQLVARRGDDDKLLQVARSLEHLPLKPSSP